MSLGLTIASVSGKNELQTLGQNLVWKLVFVRVQSGSAIWTVFVFGVLQDVFEAALAKVVAASRRDRIVDDALADWTIKLELNFVRELELFRIGLGKDVFPKLFVVSGHFRSELFHFLLNFVDHLRFFRNRFRLHFRFISCFRFFGGLSLASASATFALALGLGLFSRQTFAFALRFLVTLGEDARVALKRLA